MTFSIPAGGSSAFLLLLGMGTEQDLLVLQGAAARLASLISAPLLSLEHGDHPDLALEALRCGTGATSGQGEDGVAGLAALPIDPGLALEAGGSWAEALGAWQQPSLLLLSAAQLATGLPAAGTSLLGQHRIPLLGLIQWGGEWQSEKRRRDGLPWLGILTEAAAEGEAQTDRALLAVLERRWRQLDLP